MSLKDRIKEQEERDRLRHWKSEDKLNVHMGMNDEKTSNIKSYLNKLEEEGIISGYGIRPYGVDITIETYHIGSETFHISDFVSRFGLVVADVMPAHYSVVLVLRG